MQSLQLAKHDKADINLSVLVRYDARKKIFLTEESLSLKTLLTSLHVLGSNIP